MTKLKKIEQAKTSIESENPTPVQFLPSAMLSWRAPIILRRQASEPQPEQLRETCAAAG